MFLHSWKTSARNNAKWSKVGAPWPQVSRKEWCEGIQVEVGRGLHPSGEDARKEGGTAFVKETLGAVT